MHDETTPVAIVYDKYTGLPIGRVSRSFCEDIGDVFQPHELLHNVKAKIVQQPNLTRYIESYYENEPYGTYFEAWERCNENLTFSDAQTLYERWMRTFHPHVPFEFETIQTGHSQGDWVTMLFVYPPELFPQHKFAPKRAAMAYEEMEEALKIYRAYAIGDAADVWWETPMFNVNVKNDAISGTVEWEGAEIVRGVLLPTYSTEAEEILAVARESFLPDKDVITKLCA